MVTSCNHEEGIPPYATAHLKETKVNLLANARTIYRIFTIELFIDCLVMLRAGEQSCFTSMQVFSCQLHNFFADSEALHHNIALYETNQVKKPRALQTLSLQTKHCEHAQLSALRAWRATAVYLSTKLSETGMQPRCAIRAYCYSVE